MIDPTWMACVRTRACPHPTGAPRFITEQKHNFTLETREPLLVHDSRLFWWPRAHVRGTVWSTPNVRTNSMGLRQGPIDRTRDRLNILFVGDSVVWGSLVEEHDRFTDIAGSLLHRTPSMARTQIINAGIVGFSSHQVLQLLRTWALRRFSPQVVVLCVGVNDSWQVAASDRVEQAESARVGQRLRRALQRSDLFLFFERYLTEAVVWATTGRNPEGLTFLYPQRPMGPLVPRVSPQETAANFKEMGALLRTFGATPVVIVETTRREHPPGWEIESFDDARERIRDLARTSGWHTIDLSQLEQDSRRMSAEQFLMDFCHLSPAGHDLVGHRLAELIGEILPASR